MQGKVVEARPQALQKRKDSRYAVALDSEQNTIQKKDIVKVIDGPHAVSIFFFRDQKEFCCDIANFFNCHSCVIGEGNNLVAHATGKSH
jgi:hypothetical protein